MHITRPDGTEDLDQVPLTLEDVLHPEEGDFIVMSDPHSCDMAYLRAVSKARVAYDRTAVVLSDCRIDWNIPGVKPLGPDFALFFGAGGTSRGQTFDVAAEGVRPALVIEITSPDTRVNDVGIKVDYYHRAGVPQYVIVDAIDLGEKRLIEFIDYRWEPAGYRRLGPGERGRIWLPSLRLWLGQTRERLGGFMRLACFDPDTDQEVGDYTAISQALAAV